MLEVAYSRNCFTGRNDYRNGGGRDGHPSGVPRPYGGRGRGRGTYNGRGDSNRTERQNSGYGTPKWDSAGKEGEDGWSNFPGAKVQNSPGREAFPGGWGTGGSGSGGSNWGGSATGNGNGGWGGGGGTDSGGGGGGWGHVGGGDGGSWGGGTADANDAGTETAGNSGWGTVPKSSQPKAAVGWSGNDSGGW